MNLNGVYAAAEAVVKSLADTDVVVLAAGVKTSLGQTVSDWDNPTTAATKKGVLTAAGKTTLERAGLLGQQNLQAVTMERFDLNIAKHRLQVGSDTYEIVNTSTHPSHTTALVRKLG